MKKSTDYQALQAELNSIIEALQSAEVDVDEAIKFYERGRVVLKELEAYLTRAENRVVIIKQKDT